MSSLRATNAKEFEDAVLLTWLVAALAISVFVAVLEGGV